MKIICILILSWLCLTNCQIAGSRPQTVNTHNGAPQYTASYPTQQPVRAQPVIHPQPVITSQPNTKSIGMSYQAPPADENSKFIESFITLMFEQFKDIHLDRYEIEDGVLTNVTIHITPPTPGNLVFSGLSASIEATVDLYYGTVQGVLKLSIKNLGVDLRTDPTKLNNIDAMHIDYRLHLSDAEITADLNTMKDTTMLPSNFGHELGSVLNSASGSYKIAASRLLENVFDERSSTFVDEFLSKLGNEYQIPTKRSLGDSKFVLKSSALPFRFGDKKNIIIDFDTSAYISKTSNRGIKESLSKTSSQIIEKSKGLESSENQLINTQKEINDNRHHVLIAPHLVTSFKLENQAGLQEQVKNYFGSDVELECYPHENEFPEYRSANNVITGDQKIKCSIHPKGNRQESIFDIDLRLNFNIHPEVGKDGKTLKGEFGSIQTTEINHHDKNMEIKTTLSDKMEPMVFNQANFDFNMPFLMNQVNMKIQDKNEDKLEKFQKLLAQNIVIDVEQLEKDILPGSFKLPLPEGYKFVNPFVEIHQNGVVDISGDLVLA